MRPVNNDQAIYRFMDLFELYELAVQKRLKFTKLRLMSDKNEGLGEVLKLQAGQWGFPLRNHRVRLKEAHDELRESLYISCWTETADAMAMWLLYSKDQSSFRVKTNLTKLRDVLDSSERELFVNHYRLEAGRGVPMPPDLGPVHYVDFTAVHKRSREKLEVFDLKIKSALEKREAGKVELEELLRSKESAQLEELRHGLRLKDTAYAHENEIRASFHLRIRNAMTLDEFRQLPETIPNVLGYPMLDVASRANSPDVFHLSVTSDFIEEICFDPRMPLHKQTIVRQLLSRDDVAFTTSNVFGYLMEDVDLTIPEMY
jgi:uncharacterized protein (UPF0147 family)